MGVTADEAELLASFRAADWSTLARLLDRASGGAATARRARSQRRRRRGARSGGGSAPGAGRASPSPPPRALMQDIAAKGMWRWMAARRHASLRRALRRWALETDEAALSLAHARHRRAGVWRWMSTRKSAQLQRAFRQWSVRASRQRGAASKVTIRWTRALKQSEPVPRRVHRADAREPVPRRGGATASTAARRAKPWALDAAALDGRGSPRRSARAARSPGQEPRAVARDRARRHGARAARAVRRAAITATRRSRARDSVHWRAREGAQDRHRARCSSSGGARTTGSRSPRCSGELSGQPRRSRRKQQLDLRYVRGGRKGRRSAR